MPGGTKRTLKKDISRSGNCVPPGGLVLDISHAAPVCPYMIGICRSGNCVPPAWLVLDIPHAAPVCPGLCSSHQPEILARLSGTVPVPYFSNIFVTESAIMHR